MRLVLSIVIAIFFVPSLAAAQSWPSEWVPRAQVEARVQTKRAELYRCYVEHVPASSREHGDIVRVRMYVATTGRVFRVDFLESSYRSEAFESCVRKVLQALELGAKPAQKMRFVQTIGFQNGEKNLTFSPLKRAGGAITKESVERVAKAQKEKIEACYTEALASSPGLRGQMLVELVIDGRTGAVNSVRLVASTLDNSAVESCVLAVVRTFTFSAASDPGLVIIQYPFTFQAK